MRGLAALVAAAALWVLTTRRLPMLRIRLTVPPITTLAAGVAVGAVSAAFAFGLLGVPVAALAIGVLGAAIPVVIADARRRQRVETVAEAWPDLLTILRGRIAAGEPLPRAFIVAARRFGPPFAAAADDIETSVEYGPGFVDALDRLRADLTDPTADRILTTISVAHRSGGQRVGAVLAALTASVADELRLRKAHVAATTEQRLTAAVALLAPWVLLALTVATNPRSAEAYSSGMGAVVVIAGLSLTGIGYLIGRRIVRLSRAPRVFQ